jgi:hypothetical protein
MNWASASAPKASALAQFMAADKAANGATP